LRFVIFVGNSDLIMQASDTNKFECMSKQVHISIIDLGMLVSMCV
jgi:hypothetical protein